MTNYEYYKDAIEKLGYEHFAVRKGTGEAVDCDYLWCKNCIFDDNNNPICGEQMMSWLREEYKIPPNEEDK